VLAQNRKVVGGDGRQLIYVPMPAGNAAPAAPAPALVPDELISPAVNATGSEARPERSQRPSGREEATQ
jgi:membrane protease subunit HflK